MGSDVLRYSAFLLASVFVSSVSQVMLKRAAQGEYGSVAGEYLNPLVLSAYAIFFGATLLTVHAYRGIPLSMGPVLEATGYVYVTVFGKVFFGERVTVRRVVALGLILAGVAVYSCLG